MTNLWFAVIILCSSLSYTQAFISIKRPQPTSSNSKRSSQDDEDWHQLVCRFASSKPIDGDAAMITPMASFFGDMVDTDSDRFYALCFPPTGGRQHQHNPIRDLAAAWDASKATLFLHAKGEQVPHEERLKNAIYRTIQAMTDKIDDSGLNLDSEIVQETPNIAHSALAILAASGAFKLVLFPGNNVPPTWMDSLTRGILSMQRLDGAFCIHFGKKGGQDDDANVYQGIEFYPGEAMVALMEVYSLSNRVGGVLAEGTRQTILPAMEHAFDFYSDYYEREDVDVDVNYNIWQIQAFSRLYFALSSSSDNNGNQAKAARVATYVLTLCQGVVESKSWKYELARGRSFYPNLETVEIACGLDALADGIRVAQMTQDVILAVLERHAHNAVYFLEWSQEQIPDDVLVGRGGLGYGGVSVLEQRLDVTGHAISALTKLYNPSNSQ